MPALPFLPPARPRRRAPQPARPRLERGIAAVLMVLLLGAALTATVAGSIYYIRNTQQASTSLNAQTQAQMRAWLGVEIVRQYLQQLQGEDKLSTLMALSTPAPLTLAGSNMGDEEVQATLTGTDAANTRLTFLITGTAAKGTPAQASSRIEAVYAPQGSSGNGNGDDDTTICTPASSVTLGGNLVISGGGATITNGESYAGIAVNGNLSISGATSFVAGCAKGNITVTGGGITPGSYLYAEGDFNASNMTAPTGATVWARNIEIGNTGAGIYTALKAGAYAVNVLDASGAVVGTASVGGTLIPTTASAAIPWTTGTVRPASTGKVEVSLIDNTSAFLLDLSKISTDQTTGLIQLASGAAERLSGTASLPGTIKMVATGIVGGDIDIYTATVGTLWGHEVDVRGWSGIYSNLWANGNARVVSGTIDKLIGGGYFWATAMGCTSAALCWNYPLVLSGGPIAGNLYYGSDKTLLPTSSIWLSNVKRGQSDTSPGLPGIPYCDVRTPPVDVDTYKSQANYVFEFVDGLPQLTIQHVQTKSGTSLDGVYPVLTTDLRTLAGERFMQCGWWANHCFRDGNASTTSGWKLNGLFHFPPGIVWFDRAVTVDGSPWIMKNTLLAKGQVTLTTTGGTMYAPNLALFTSQTCGDDFYPSNLCNSASSLKTWTDGDGQTHTGLPLANVAVASNAGLTVASWSIYGSVLLGGQINTSGGATWIYGFLTSDANRVGADSSLGSGALYVNTAAWLTDDQAILPSETCTAANSSGSGTSSGSSTPSISVLWTRYL